MRIYKWELLGIYRVIATNPAGSTHDKALATVKRSTTGVDQRPTDE